MKAPRDIETLLVIAVTSIAVIAISTYFSAYFLFDWQISKDPIGWGPMGDYFGGILNPVIALAALVALIRATRLQKTEFEATRIHLETESKRNEIYRLIANLEQKIEAKLDVEVRNDGSSTLIIFGPLNQYLRPGWRPPVKTYISLGASNLCTPINTYSKKILDLINELEVLLNEYDSIGGTSESIVHRHLMGQYSDLKLACEEQIATKGNKK